VKARRRNRFQKVVQRLHFKGANSVFVMRSHEHDGWYMRTCRAAQYSKAVKSGHLYIEKNEVWAFARNRFHRGRPAVSLTDYFDIGLRLQKLQKPVPGERLVVHDEHSNARAASWRIHGVIGRKGSVIVIFVPLGDSRWTSTS
jgi:hypothetical protein